MKIIDNCKRTFVLCLMILGMGVFSSQTFGDNRKIIAFPDVDSAELPPYSAVVRAGDFIYVSGVLGHMRGKSQLVSGGVSAQARQSLTYIKESIERAGGSFENTAKCMVLLADINDFPAMNEVWRTFFPKNPPARSTLIVKEIPHGAAIEIDCTAIAN